MDGGIAEENGLLIGGGRLFFVVSVRIKGIGHR